MAGLVLGPLLRYTGSTQATVWVETDAPCEVAVLDARQRTFSRRGPPLRARRPERPRGGLGAARTRSRSTASACGRRATAGRRRRSTRASTSATRGSSSARAASATRSARPYTLPRRARRRDSASTRSGRSRGRLQSGQEEWPDCLLLLGDQVYADETSEETRAFIRARRDTSQPPGEQVADFEEYARLYREAWSDPDIRWLLATVPSTMIFDDHDVHDDWNISEAWVRDLRATLVVGGAHHRRVHGVLDLPAHRQPGPAGAGGGAAARRARTPAPTAVRACARSRARSTASRRRAGSPSTATSAARGSS